MVIAQLDKERWRRGKAHGYGRPPMVKKAVLLSSLEDNAFIKGASPTTMTRCRPIRDTQPRLRERLPASSSCAARRGAFIARRVLMPSYVNIAHSRRKHMVTTWATSFLRADRQECDLTRRGHRGVLEPAANPPSSATNCLWRAFEIVKA